MKKRNVFLVALLVLTIIGGAVFAGGQQDAADEDRMMVVGYSQCDSQQAWRWAETESVQNEAKKRGIELKYNDAQAVQANQIAAVRSFIAQGVDGILLAPQVMTGFGPVLQEAK
ncbi:MAG TPA: sugar ABC transporter substrate-binding protein, partial [Spirochaeta sp.]|nr:sugar ABC transporter substrate-binding protein [Spirochaeta sp.]